MYIVALRPNVIESLLDLVVHVFLHLSSRSSLPVKNKSSITDYPSNIKIMKKHEKHGKTWKTWKTWKNMEKHEKRGKTWENMKNMEKHWTTWKTWKNMKNMEKHGKHGKTRETWKIITLKIHKTSKLYLILSWSSC